MDNIEKIISQNREFFSQEKMPEGHLKRFEQKLKTEKKPVMRILGPWMAAAAVIAVVLLLPVFRNTTPKEQKGVLSQVSDQYTEVEFYFTSSINNSVKEFNTMLETGIATTDDSLMIQEELNELEIRHQQLTEDLKLAPDDERIINAMIEVYRKKLELMNSILEQLYAVKKQKEIMEQKPQTAL